METNWFKRNIPILSWLPAYDRSWFSADAIAGLTVWGLLIPEFDGLCGSCRPAAPVWPLYPGGFTDPLRRAGHIASHVCPAHFGYGGPDRFIGDRGYGHCWCRRKRGGGDPAVYQQYAVAFTLVVGAVFLAAGLARLGWITQFLSKPVLDGFVTGLAVFVMVGQLNKLFGVEKPPGNTVQKFFGILRELPEANWVSFALGAGAWLS